MKRALFAVIFVACGTPHRQPAGGDDASIGSGGPDAHSGGGGSDAAVAIDAHTGGGSDGSGGGMHDASSGGVITGGPCMSGAAGGTAYRILWTNAGGQAQVVYEVDGLPDKSRDHAGAYGYQIGFTPSYVDPFLGEGGLQLDGSDFVDLEITTSGVVAISKATLSIYGRSFAVSTDGSFNWQTFVGYNETPNDFVSNVPPYKWYSADMTTEINAGDSNTLIRIKAGPSSGALAVHRIELCLQAS